ncbi:hypothetical protein F4703DRAFT_1107329 [Phycomyces blakesleeanus]
MSTNQDTVDDLSNPELVLHQDGNSLASPIRSPKRIKLEHSNQVLVSFAIPLLYTRICFILLYWWYFIFWKKNTQKHTHIRTQTIMSIYINLYIFCFTLSLRTGHITSISQSAPFAERRHPV